VRKGQSVLQVAKKKAEKHIRKTIGKAVNPISDEVKAYISELVEADMPEMAPAILMMDIQDIVDIVLDFVEIYQTHNGIRVNVDMEQVVSLIESITSLVRHNPDFIEETLGFFNDLEIDPKVIESIVVNNVKKTL